MSSQRWNRWNKLAAVGAEQSDGAKKTAAVGAEHIADEMGAPGFDTPPPSAPSPEQRFGAAETGAVGAEEDAQAGFDSLFSDVAEYLETAKKRNRLGELL